MVGLWDRRDSLVSPYLGGMQRRLEIARGLLHAPHVLFLDEPTVGLDPQTRSSISKYINQLKRREAITIFLTTHYMDEAEHCDRTPSSTTARSWPSTRPRRSRPAWARTGCGSDSDDPAAIRELADLFGIEAAMHEGAVTFAVGSRERSGAASESASSTQAKGRDPVGQRDQAVARRRVDVLHRHHRAGTPRHRDRVRAHHGGPHAREAMSMATQTPQAAVPAGRAGQPGCRWRCRSGACTRTCGP